MMKMDLQLFGGRGSSGGKSGSASGRPAGRIIPQSRVLVQNPGAVIAVQHFSAVTGKPDGKYVEYTLDDSGTFHSQGYGSFNQSNTGLKTLQSKNGVVPEIISVKTGKSWAQDQLDRQRKAKAAKQRRKLGME